MTTQIYGASDDLIEIEGQAGGEVGFYNSGNDPKDALLTCSDGTVLTIRYGKPGGAGIWAIAVLRRGDLFDRLDTCEDEDAERYSDTAHFRDGLKWVHVSTEWQRAA